MYLSSVFGVRIDRHIICFGHVLTWDFPLSLSVSLIPVSSAYPRLSYLYTSVPPLLYLVQNQVSGPAEDSTSKDGGVEGFAAGDLLFPNDLEIEVIGGISATLKLTPCGT